MRLVILTRDTDRHRFFVNSIRAAGFQPTVVVELIKPLVSAQAIEWEHQHQSWEKNFFLEVPRDWQVPIHQVEHINGPESLAVLQAGSFDLGVVFGTSKLSPEIFKSPKWGMINVHRGDMRVHRGLDSDYWSVYQMKPEALGVCVHEVAETLDTGNLITYSQPRLDKADCLFSVRFATSKVATEAVVNILISSLKTGSPPLSHPILPGTYYSVMPWEKRLECVQKFPEFLKRYLDYQEKNLGTK